MIIVDTREKKWDHIEALFVAWGIPYKVQKLDVGDYVNTDSPGVIVDRKASLDEVAQNLYSKDSSRFWRELRRASERRIRLIILVEYGRAHSIEDLKDWKSKYNPYVDGKKLANEMFKCHVAYGVDWRFCKKHMAAGKILELLKYDDR